MKYLNKRQVIWFDQLTNSVGHLKNLLKQVAMIKCKWSFNNLTLSFLLPFNFKDWSWLLTKNNRFFALVHTCTKPIWLTKCLMAMVMRTFILILVLLVSRSFCELNWESCILTYSTLVRSYSISNAILSIIFVRDEQVQVKAVVALP